MKIVIDMNLSPEWVMVFEREGWHAVHWSSIGEISAPDVAIMHWAREQEHAIFTHDLDFGILLALTREGGPSVIQLRNEDSLPEALSPTVISVIKRHEAFLQSGALVTIDKRRSRVRVLPI